MINGDKQFGYSLHHIDQDCNAGDMIDIRTKEIDHKKTVLEGMKVAYSVDIQMVADAIEKFARGRDLHEDQIKQNAEDGRYYTFLTEEELDLCKDKGITLVNREEIAEFLVKYFGGKHSGLGEVINKAVMKLYDGFMAI